MKGGCTAAELLTTALAVLLYKKHTGKPRPRCQRMWFLAGSAGLPPFTPRGRAYCATAAPARLASCACWAPSDGHGCVARRCRPRPAAARQQAALRRGAGASIGVARPGALCTSGLAACCLDFRDVPTRESPWKCCAQGTSAEPQQRGAAAAMDTGRRIGSYVLLRRLGAGGFATVYEAWWVIGARQAASDAAAAAPAPAPATRI